MLAVGAEIRSIGDSLSRMGAAYGAKHTNVFVITSSIELIIDFADGKSITRTRRIKSAGAIDFAMPGKRNALSCRCAIERLPAVYAFVAYAQYLFCHL